MKIELLHGQRPDDYCELMVFVDGKEASAVLADARPVPGLTLAEMAHHEATVAASLSPAAREAFHVMMAYSRQTNSDEEWPLPDSDGKPWKATHRVTIRGPRDEDSRYVMLDPEPEEGPAMRFAYGQWEWRHSQPPTVAVDGVGVWRHMGCADDVLHVETLE